ncbi:MAG: STAS domain-containing protein [Planctomycetes bacterium]|nr:STAS domain-containing protein [Planctomycetota bacterium]
MRELWIGTEKMPDGGVRIQLQGAVDAYSYRKLTNTFNNLIDYGVCNIVVDMSDVESLNCAGAHIFLGAGIITRENGGRMAMLNPAPRVRQMLDLLDCSQLFEVSAEPFPAPAGRPECPNLKTNLDYCNCSFPLCHRKGRCCECLHYHRTNDELPACFFPKEEAVISAGKTPDRSFERFMKLRRF